MKFEKQVFEDVLVISIDGEIMGGPEEDDFRNIIDEAIQNEQIKIVLDLADAKWMNSSGLGMLIRALTVLRSSEGDLKLANVSERIRRPIEITRLNAVLLIYDSIDQAVKSYKE
ncbi:STAS domain-containing protein [candidate division KSB1 bacterium]|nr:STAS domain-containing protein [candidate division KSB1 bacterium]